MSHQQRMDADLEQCLNEFHRKHGDLDNTNIYHRREFMKICRRFIHKRLRYGELSDIESNDPAIIRLREWIRK